MPVTPIASLFGLGITGAEAFAEESADHIASVFVSLRVEQQTVYGFCFMLESFNDSLHTSRQVSRFT